MDTDSSAEKDKDSSANLTVATPFCELKTR